MGQKLHKVRGTTLEDARERMVRLHGPDAVVLRTGESREGGFLGFGARKQVELTVAVPDGMPVQRPLSAPEKQYAAQQAGSETDDRFSSTVAHFQKMLLERKPASSAPTRDTSSRSGAAPATRSASGGAATAASPMLQFHPGAGRDSAEESLRKELRDVRETLEVLVAETPGAGLPGELSPYYRYLIDRGVTRKIAAALLKRILGKTSLDQLRSRQAFAQLLRAELRTHMRATGGLSLTPGRCRVVALAGTTGVGKTTTIAKLAAYYALRQRARVALVTADTYRIAAPQQLQVYADIIGLPMKVANDEREAASAVRSFSEYDLVLVDTAGGSQFNVRHLQELRALLGAAHVDEVHQVVSAGAQLEDLRLVMENFRCLQPVSLLFTKLDETRKPGVLFSLMVETRLPVSFLSVGQDVPDDLRIAQPDDLAALIVEGKISRGRPSA